jgi:hypothetical protein
MPARAGVRTDAAGDRSEDNGHVMLHDCIGLIVRFACAPAQAWMHPCFIATAIAPSCANAKPSSAAPGSRARRCRMTAGKTSPPHWPAYCTCSPAFGLGALVLSQENDDGEISGCLVARRSRRPAGSGLPFYASVNRMRAARVASSRAPHDLRSSADALPACARCAPSAAWRCVSGLGGT